MSGGGDLYRINLDPKGPGSSLPGDVNTRGSIGGSDVGANQRDDQRVRDLIEEYMEQYQILQQLNLLNISGGDLVGGWLASNWLIVVQNDDPPGAYTSPLVGDNHTITHPGGPLLLEISARTLLSFNDTAGPAGVYTALIYGQLFIDDVFICEATMETHYRYTSGTYSYYHDLPLTHRIYLDPDDTNGIGGGIGTTQAEQIAACAAGEHTYRLNWDWFIPNAATDTTDFQISMEAVTVRSVQPRKITRVEY